MQRRIEGWFSLCVLLLVIGLAFVAQGLREDPKAPAHSVTSTAGNGRRGFFLLLQELGFAPLEWRRAPAELPRGEDLLWLPERPQPWKPKEESKEPAGKAPIPLPGHGLEHYRRFVEEGGTLVAPFSKEMLGFLTEDLGLPGAQALALLHGGSREARRVRLDTGEALELELDSGKGLRPLPDGSPGRELWMLENQAGSTGPESLVAVEFPLGAGRVVLLSEDGFLDNGAIGKSQHALAGVRLLERLSRGGKLLFDEYCLGVFEPESALALSASPRIFLLSLHVLALLVFFVWAHSFARAFPRDPPPRAKASPLERAEALARTWKSAGRQRIGARALRRAAEQPRVRKSTADELEALARELEAPANARR
jgi:hypothetical protein